MQETMEAPFIFQPRNATAASDQRSGVIEPKHRPTPTPQSGLIQMVNLVAFLVKAMDGERTELAGKGHFLFKPRSPAPPIYDRGRSDLDS